MCSAPYMAYDTLSSCPSPSKTLDETRFGTIQSGQDDALHNVFYYACVVLPEIGEYDAYLLIGSEFEAHIAGVELVWLGSCDFQTDWATMKPKFNHPLFCKRVGQNLESLKRAGRSAS